MSSALLTCTPGFEQMLCEELALFSLTAQPSTRGWILAGGSPREMQSLFSGQEPCFGRRLLDRPLEQPFRQTTQLVQILCDFFCQAIRDEKIDQPWPLSVQSLGTDGIPATGITRIEKLFLERLKKALARVSKLAVIADNLPSGFHCGLFVALVDSEKAFISRRCWSGGQQRMRFKKGAPSRSFLKVEEAYPILGRTPGPGETVVDLGAAPGGWSFSAAERGARVLAVDNGPLKAGALHHPLIEHRRQDAFDYQPSQKTESNWLFCDLVEEPHHVLRLVRRWITAPACRYFIVNLKFGRSDPIPLLARLFDAKNGLRPFCRQLKARHLYHDREEITLMGETK